jgi:hypothetical protein
MVFWLDVRLSNRFLSRVSHGCITRSGELHGNSGAARKVDHYNPRERGDVTYFTFADQPGSCKLNRKIVSVPSFKLN